VHRKTRAYGSAGDIKALTRSPFMLTSQVLEPPSMVDVTKQLELQVLDQSLPLKQQLEQAKHSPLTDDDQLLDMQKQQLEQESDQANCEDLDGHLAGNVLF